MNPAAGPFSIREREDILSTVARARSLGERLGLQRHRVAELAVLVSELATNIIRHTEGGEVALYLLASGEPGLRVLATDRGPALRDFETALVDDCGPLGPVDPLARMQRGGLRRGLGAVNRLGDALSHCVTDDGGNRFEAVVRNRPHRRSFHRG